MSPQTRGSRSCSVVTCEGYEVEVRQVSHARPLAAPLPSPFRVETPPQGSVAIHELLDMSMSSIRRRFSILRCA